MPPELPHDLGDGLVLRRSTAADVERLGAFNAAIHSDSEHGMAEEWFRDWTRDLMSGRHPTFDPADFTIVENERGAIVSCQCLIPQTWSYGGVTFSVGRIELVGTLPEYRRRGLVRAQMRVVHEWCRERGRLVQAITGIPHYYRRFGYEMALDLAGGRAGLAADVPTADGDSGLAMRPATPADAAFMTQCAAPARERWLVADDWDEATFGHVIAGTTPTSLQHLEAVIITAAGGKAVGYLLHLPDVERQRVRVIAYELAGGADWVAVTPAVLRYLGEWGAARAASAGDQVAEIVFGVGSRHPALDVAAKFLARTWKPYGWYLRIGDLAGFLRLVAPVLEARLAGSGFGGYTGPLRIDAGDGGLRMQFTAGALDAVEACEPATHREGDVLFPNQTFLQAVFGRRDIDALADAYPDCRADNDTGLGLSRVLFPQADSHVMGLG